MTNGLRTSVVGVVLLSIVASAGYIYTSRVVDNMKDRIYMQNARKLSLDFQKSINEKIKDVSIATAVMSQSDVKYSDRVALALRRYSLFDNISFYYEKNKNSKEIKKIIPTLFFYKDRPYISIKAAAPVYDLKGNFKGNLYSSVKYNASSLGLDTKNYQAVAFVDNGESRYISNPFYFTDLIEALNHLPQNKKRNLERYVVDTGSGLLLTAFNLKSANSTSTIKIILAAELDKIDLSAIDQEVKIDVLIAVLLFLVLLLLLHKVFITNYTRSVHEHYQVLKDTMKSKELEIQRQADIIKFMATNDPLTGLDNKVSLTKKLDDIITAAKIEDHSVGVVCLDLDKFKKINDIYGHDIGDILLQKVAQRLEECIRKDDTLARISGDEFVIIENKMTDVSNANLIEKISLAMKRPFYIKNKEINITFSIGRGIFGVDGDDGITLLKNAETAMYIAKDIGPNNYVSYDESMGKVSQKKLELDRNIRNALKNEELIPYYQPKIDASTNQVVGLEALIRWKDAKKGLIHPGEFIPFCEGSELIIDIDKYMLVHSMRQVLQWKKEGIHTGKLSVNISTKKLEKSNFVSELRQIVLTEKFDPQYLDIEILESQIMSNPKKVIKILHELKALGLSISIDDFGTGYSSLSYLKELPIDTVKIDRSFIIDLPGDGDSVSIVRTIIALAKNLNLNIIAEGVETKEQLDFLMKEGCTNIQGYYFSKPLSPVVCKDYLASKSDK